MTIYEADWICPVSSPPIRNGSIAVENGRIVPLLLGEDGARSAQGEGHNRVTFSGCAIIPGFVNAHCHLELTILRGFLDDLPFSAWIPRLTRAKYQQLTRDDLLVSARLGCLEMIRAGVTCLGEVMDLGTSWSAMLESGLQGIAYQEVFGPADSQADQALADLMKKVDRYRSESTATFRIGVSPHAPYTVSAKLFQAVNRYAEWEAIPLTTHIAESPEEGLFVRSGTGVFAERWRERGIAVSPARCSPVAYLDRLGLVRSGALLVHAVDLEDTDFEILRNRRPAVAHCPKSNAKLGQGIARLSEIRDAVITVGLGTDSVASNNVIDMFDEMRSAIFQQRARARSITALGADAAFRMATLGGAECLGLAEELGSLDPGKRADFAVVDLTDPALQPIYDPVASMVYSASRQNVKATFIGGREIKMDSEEILRRSAAIAERLVEL